tara:strand:- start:179 stop:280 length:102 start_codon:yes stop_codon:yes gene_type:complete
MTYNLALSKNKKIAVLMPWQKKIERFATTAKGN